MSMNCECNLKKTLSSMCFSCKNKSKNLDAQDFMRIVPLAINYKCPAAALRREKAQNVTLVKKLQKEARKARLKSLYNTDDFENIKLKSRCEYIKEFIQNTLNDKTFIAIE